MKLKTFLLDNKATPEDAQNSFEVRTNSKYFYVGKNGVTYSYNRFVLVSYELKKNNEKT